MKIDKMEKDELTYHVPVLLKESVDGMNIHPDGTYVDVTFGGAGHSREILSRLGEGGRLLGFDQDEDAERNIVNDPHFTFVRSNFRYLQNFLRYHDIEQVDAILADLGVSSHHFDDSERGFSFRFDGALDMRMNKRAGLTAADIVNTYGEKELADLIYRFGEERKSRRIAAKIVEARQTAPVATTRQLAEIIYQVIFKKPGQPDPATRTFQALRIAVNDELGELERGLAGGLSVLKPGGRLAVVTFHSLEDRIVKNFFKQKAGKSEGVSRYLPEAATAAPAELAFCSKAVPPTAAEVEANPRAHSAKLRYAIKSDKETGQ